MDAAVADAVVEVNTRRFDGIFGEPAMRLEGMSSTAMLCLHSSVDKHSEYAPF